MQVNANSLNVQDALRQHSFRAMAVVHRTAQPLVQYICRRVMQPQRGDSLVLCQVWGGEVLPQVPDVVF